MGICQVLDLDIIHPKLCIDIIQNRDILYIVKRRNNSTNQKGNYMAYKYEIEVEERIKDLDWGAEIKAAKSFGLTDEQADAFIRSEFLEGASPALRASFARNFKITEEGVVRRERTRPQEPWETVPPIEMACANSDEVESGLYFVGMIGITPEEKKYYLVKVGEGKRGIGSRIGDYKIYNPMIYHNNCCLKKSEYDCKDGETNCHWYIAERAYGRAQNSHEWFYVDEETYFELCDTFADKEMFKAIAEGRD